MFIKKHSRKFVYLCFLVEIPYGWMPLVGKSETSASVDTDPLTAQKENLLNRSNKQGHEN
jgi:hypothetical protein